MRARPLQASRLLHDSKVRSLDDQLKDSAPESEEARRLRLRIVELEATIALRLDGIARSRR